MTPPLPRILAIMGSGETAPPLAPVHRGLFERLGPPPVPAVLIDTPYGFQENADDISGRTIDFFRESVGRPIGVASMRSSADDALARATAIARIREARYVFSGPGSPTYALRAWSGSGIPDALAEKLAGGGALVFASAAALTLGLLTVPVYEIYKVGEPPRWLPGLNLLSAAGLRAAVIPHFDNAEGGNHDTRFCYLGERRLAVLEAEMPDDAFVLGVDGHTALILDLGAGTATVLGRGGVTVRVHGRSTVFPSGAAVPIEALRDAAHGMPARAAAAPAAPDGTGDGPESLRATTSRLERAHESAIAHRDAEGAVAAILELHDAILGWSRDTGPAVEIDRAREVLRSLIVRLGERAAEGMRDPRDAVAPFVDALVSVRLRAREARDWPTADDIRRRLTEAGIRIADTVDGVSWELAPTAADDAD